ncbi:glycosyltransferase family 2 protein [Bacteroidota bacterium]
MKIAVVILNWNGQKFLELFLPIVIEHSKEAEIIVADNASSDHSVEFLKENYPDIRIIINKTNGGFSKGYNDALKQIKADYYILLNSDIEVTENWIQPVIELMESDEKIAVCQPKIRSYYTHEYFEYAGAAGGFIDKYGYPFCRGRVFQSMEKDQGQYDENCEIFWATGACMFVKADIYHHFGGLDEDFFAHMEEIDFCWRLKNEGYKVMYCGSSTVFHIGGGTLPKISSRKTYLNFRNNFTLLFKNLPTRSLPKVFLVRLFLDALAAVRFLFDSGINDFFAVIRAHYSMYFKLARHLNKRKRIHHNKVSRMYMKSIVLEHYLRKKQHFTDLDQGKFS